MKTSEDNRGFIEIIIIVIVAVIILAFFGINPLEIWTAYVLPVLNFVLNAFLSIIGFIIEITIQAAEKLGLKK